MKNMLLILTTIIAEKNTNKLRNFLIDIADNSTWNVFMSSWRDLPVADKLKILGDIIQLLRNGPSLNHRDDAFEVMIDLLSTTIKVNKKVGPIRELLEKVLSQPVYSEDQDFDTFFKYEVNAYLGNFKRELNLALISKQLSERKMTIAIKRPLQPLQVQVDANKPVVIEGPTLVIAKYTEGNQVIGINRDNDDDEREVTLVRFISDRDISEKFLKHLQGLELLESVIKAIKNGHAYWTLVPLEVHEKSEGGRDPNSKYRSDVKDFCTRFDGLFEALGIANVDKRGTGNSVNHPTAKLNPTVTVIFMEEDDFSES